MMEITYIFRSQSKQRSIERVFEPIIQEMISAGHRVDVQYATSGSTLFSTLWKNIRYFSKLSKSTLCHITGDVQYVACLMDPNNTILTIHDLVPLHNKKVPWYSKWLCYWLWYYIPLRRLKVITCISEATRLDLISFFPWAKEKIVVVPNPVSTSFRYDSKVFNTDCPYILHLGTKSNKNLLRVIEALSSIKCHLRIIGKISHDERLALDKYGIDYSNEEYISDDDIITEYKRCDIVSFPSLFEGFGMPIIEGQATGRVVVTSNIEPMLSVSGGHAALVNPNDILSIRSSVLRIILDSNWRDSLIDGGLKNAAHYSPLCIMDSYIQCYLKLHNTK